MNVLVTGSHGYIGSVLCKTLSEQGWQVYAVDNKEHLGGDFRYFRTVYNRSFDDDFIVNSVLANNIHTIFHLAASSLLGPSATDPLQYYWNNTAKTISFIRKLAKAGWKGRIIFSSTAAVYGDQVWPVTEKDMLIPCNHYGKSKLMCEQALDLAHMYGIKTTVFRYFNVAGAYGDVGQDSEEPHIITRICNTAYDSNIPLTVYGSDYTTRDGTCIRDYVHVRDICTAQIFAMDNQIDGTFNLGTNTGSTVKEIIYAFWSVNDIPISFSMGERREGDPAFLVANPNKFVDMGFKYQYSSIMHIVCSAWKYFKGKKDGI